MAWHQCRHLTGLSVAKRRAFVNLHVSEGSVFDLVEDTALMRHPIQMALQRLFEPWAPVTDDQLGGLFRHPFGVQGPHQRPQDTASSLAARCHESISQCPSGQRPRAVSITRCCLRFTARLRPLLSSSISPVGTASLRHRPSTSTSGGGDVRRAVLNACACASRPHPRRVQAASDKTPPRLSCMP